MAISVVAELEARGVGQLDLSEALELTALVALRGAERGRRYTVRWLQRWLDETTESLADVAMVATALACAWRCEPSGGACVPSGHRRKSG